MRAVVMLLFVSVVTTSATPAAAAPSKCAAAKVRAAGKKASTEAKCCATALAKDVPVSAKCIAKPKRRS